MTLWNPVLPLVILFLSENSIHLVLPVVNHLVAVVQPIDSWRCGDSEQISNPSPLMRTHAGKVQQCFHPFTSNKEIIILTTSAFLSSTPITDISRGREGMV